MAKTKKDDGNRKEFISNIVEIVGSTQLSNAALELEEVDINNERERLWRNEELHSQDNVYAIVKYNNQLFKNMNANVFVPVQKKYPSARKILSTIKANLNWSDISDKTQIVFENYENFDTILFLSGVFSGEESISKQYLELDTKVKQISELHEIYMPALENYLINLAHAINVVSEINCISVDKVVKNEIYQKEILQKTFATKQHAESFIKLDFEYDKLSYDISSKVLKMVIKYGEPNAMMKRDYNSLPTEKAINFMQNEEFKYKLGVVNRAFADK